MIAHYPPSQGGQGGCLIRILYPLIVPAEFSLLPRGGRGGVLFVFCILFKGLQNPHCFLPAGAAKLLLSLKIRTHLRPRWISVKCTPVVPEKMNTPHPCRLSVRHPMYWRRNRNSYATGSAILPAIHYLFIIEQITTKFSSIEMIPALLS